jgi:hypothetical protein
VPAAIKDDSKVTIIEGSFSDEEGLKKAAASGATIFASFAGPTAGAKGTVSKSRFSCFTTTCCCEHEK